MKKLGNYIVLEGTDGSGKSTIITRLANKLEVDGIKVWTAHEPGSTPIGEAIRTIIKDINLERTALTELLLFTAARSELAHKIKEKLMNGTWVISSRNYLSSIIYQGEAGNLGADFVQQLSKQLLPDYYLKPDLTIILDINPQVAEARRQSRNAKASQRDIFESRDSDFQQQLITGYQKIADELQLPLINSRDSVEAVTEQVYDLIKQHLL